VRTRDESKRKNAGRVIREITEADRDFYYRDKKFDVDDYK